MKDSDKSLSMLWYSLGIQLLLCQAFSKWRKNPNASLRVIYKDLYKKTFANKDNDYDSKLGLYSAMGSTQASLMRQTLVLNYEFLRHNIDDKMSNELKNIKNTAFANPNNYNTAKFLDIIRQSFSHNNIYKEFPNWILNKEGKVEINYKNDILTFNFLELQTIINEFLLLKKEHTRYSLEINENELHEQIKKKKLNVDNVGRYITCINEKGNSIVLDEKQKNAMVNLINSTNFEYLVRYNYHVFVQSFPFKNNAGTLLRYTNRVFRNLCSLEQGFQNRQAFINSAKEFEKVVDIIDKVGSPVQEQHIVDFMYNNSMIPEVIIYSNALFTLFSLHTPEDLKTYADGIDIDLKRLRNSLMHGRYYFNYNDGIEFYDGKDNESLKHIGTLSIKQITSIFDKYILENAVSHNISK